MAELKTLKNNASVIDFINSVDDEQKRKDAHELLKIFEDITKEKATMRGASIIGFGEYHYKSERSRQEGDRPLAAFSPRKTSLTVYIMMELDNYSAILEKLGKYKTSKGCLYFKRLSDVDLELLKKLIKVSFLNAKKRHSG
ncbi:MAG TPA: DUF1801 domain-containing protein [Candidatus Absconditabacterales bacterium]|nr:DUF1801 domain-containing protein [Candidatus Absconditabacterales bacterium]HMT27081.1 DUF1801 domain-containing protein [Candidatus Absconditabacterales bacterium]